MKRVLVYIFLLCAMFGMNAQEVLILPFDADSLTNDHKALTPVYVAICRFVSQVQVWEVALV